MMKCAYMEYEMSQTHAVNDPLTMSERSVACAQIE